MLLFIWLLSALVAAQPAPPAPSARPVQVLFLCPHGAAKSVLASAYFARLARERGLTVRVDAAGTEPDPRVSPKVASLLVSQGYDVPTTPPRAVSSADVEGADLVISLGCDVSRVPGAAKDLRRWDEVPGPGEDLAGAEAAIRRRVEALVDELVRLRR